MPCTLSSRCNCTKSTAETDSTKVGASHANWNHSPLTTTPPLFRRFLLSQEKHTALIGFREWIFSDKSGALGSFAASAEFAFGTIVQRTMSYPARGECSYMLIGFLQSVHSLVGCAFGSIIQSIVSFASLLRTFPFSASSSRAFNLVNHEMITDVTYICIIRLQYACTTATPTCSTSCTS